jgi:RimJ/RimL family protein N-acetyltransferase
MLLTRRLLLSKPSISDIALFSEILSCPQQTRYLPNRAPYSIIQQENYLNKRINHWHQHGFGTFVIRLKEDSLSDTPAKGSRVEDTKLGFIGVEYAPKSDKVDIRFALVKEHEGLGYTSEAANAVLDYMSTNTQHRHIYGVAMPNNQASKAVLIKLGMTPALGEKLYDSDDLDCFSLVLNLN